MPDLDDLEDEYDAPTAALDTDEIQGVLGGFPELERFAAALRSSGSLLDSVDDARESANERSGDGVDLRGALTIALGCPGDQPQPSYDAQANGSLTIDLAVQDGQIKQAFWATAERCVLRGELGSLVFPVELDGRIAIDLGAPIGLNSPWQRDQLLVSLQGSISFDALTLRNVTARFSATRFEYLQELPTGGSIVLVVTDEGVGLRDSDTTWICERGGSACGVR